MIDTAFSSLATFAVGFFAARHLEPTILGAYALVFSAFQLATKVPQQLLFTPAEVMAVTVPNDSRLGLLPRSLALGVLPALLPALGIPLWVLALSSHIPPAAIMALTVTAITSAFASPIQDHVRRMLHLANASWYAAIVSLVHFGVITVATLAAWVTGVSLWWVPFGALALGNVVSLAVGIALARGIANGEDFRSYLRSRELLLSGRWLLVVGLLPAAAGFIAAALVSRLAGSAALGYVEAARIVGVPPLVLAAGLSAVLGPRSVQAAQERHAETARHITLLFSAVILVTAVPYLALVGFAWAWNPVVKLVPSAYVIRGLVTVTLIANSANAVILPQQYQLIGARMEPFLARVETVGNVVRVGVAGAAGVLGSFAIPIGFFILAVARWVGYLRGLALHYATIAAPGSEQEEARAEVLAERVSQSSG